MKPRLFLHLKKDYKLKSEEKRRTVKHSYSLLAQGTKLELFMVVEIEDIYFFKYFLIRSGIIIPVGISVN